MENASKALLIAAAVLIVILIIAFGMRIFNSTGDSAAQVEATSSSQALQTFNGQFSGYIGNNRSAATIRALTILVNDSNTKNPQHQVTPITTVPVDGQVYNVAATYDNTTGYLTGFTIS